MKWRQRKESLSFHKYRLIFFLIITCLTKEKRRGIRWRLWSWWKKVECQWQYKIKMKGEKHGETRWAWQEFSKCSVQWEGESRLIFLRCTSFPSSSSLLFFYLIVIYRQWRKWEDVEDGMKRTAGRGKLVERWERVESNKIMEDESERIVSILRRWSLIMKDEREHFFPLYFLIQFKAWVKRGENKKKKITNPCWTGKRKGFFFLLLFLVLKIMNTTFFFFLFLLSTSYHREMWRQKNTFFFPTDRDTLGKGEDRWKNKWKS